MQLQPFIDSMFKRQVIIPKFNERILNNPCSRIYESTIKSQHDLEDVNQHMQCKKYLQINYHKPFHPQQLVHSTIWENP